MTTKEIIAEIAKDREFAKSVAELKNPEKVYEALKGRGLTDSFEDFKKAAAEIKEEAGKMTTADIDAIVGGSDTTAGVGFGVACGIGSVAVAFL